MVLSLHVWYDEGVTTGDESFLPIMEMESIQVEIAPCGRLLGRWYKARSDDGDALLYAGPETFSPL